MNLSLSVLLVVLFFWKGQAQADFKVFYRCQGLTLNFDAYAESGTLKDVYAVSKYTSCGTSSSPSPKFTPGTGLIGNPAKGQITSSAGDVAACDYNGDTNSRSVTLVLLQTKGIISNGDKKTTLTCGKDDAHNSDVAATITTIDSDLTAVNPTKGLLGLELKVVAGNTAENALHNAALPTGDINLGDSLMIIARYDITSGTNDKVLIETCTAVPNGKAGPVIRMISAKCPDTRDGVYGANNVKQIGYKDTTNKRFIVKTAPFKAFLIPDETSIDIKCTVLYCASGTGCDIADCAADGRRRRAAETTKVLRNQTMTTTIFFGTHPRNQGTSTRTQDISVGDCLSHVSFISTVAILAVLLVVSLAVSVFFCSKLIRQNNNNQQKEAYPNPAYKA